jgi:protocatechuate 3,4-dioxygenase beta subunit
MARWHGALRGWLKTSCDGHYRIETIRPGRYPDGRIPAHIHMTVMPEGGREFFIDEIVFTDDALVDARFRATAHDVGGSGIVTPWKDSTRTWRVKRDIILPDAPR